MSIKITSLPPNSEPLLPTRDHNASVYRIEENLSSLSGVTSRIAGKLNKRAHTPYAGISIPENNTLLVTDYLRVRSDETLALHPTVTQAVSDKHHNQLLVDLVDVYFENLRKPDGSYSTLDPVPSNKVKVVKCLNKGYEFAKPHPEFALSSGDIRNCDGRMFLPATDYPIQIHDILADLRSEGIVTNLAKTKCDACGHEAGSERAAELRSQGFTVNGYAGIAASPPYQNPIISVQSFDESQWTDGDVVDLVMENAQNHNFLSEIRVERATLLKQ